MAEEYEMIQDENAPPKRRGKKLILLLLMLLLLGGAAGGAYFYFFRAAAEPEAEEETAESNTNKEKKSKKKKNSSNDETEVPNDDKVKHIIELQPFIVNLSDTENPRYLRMTVSVGIGGEGEEKPNPLFVTKVRNAMIIVLSAKSSDDIITIEGKAKLRKELLKAAQKVSSEPPIEAIYITDFIIQM